MHAGITEAWWLRLASGASVEWADEACCPLGAVRPFDPPIGLPRAGLSPMIHPR